ncbi:hypothetical protein [Haloparvum sp. PAK95]|uniref:hypothetical protein n=1 Tax=Haloparvum sp. PAK95 TaxID=3418962 RepID=UPI003D2ECF8D
MPELRGPDGLSWKHGAVAVITVLVLLSAWTVPAVAASGVVEVEAALDDDSDATTMQFSFVASQNGTVTLGSDDYVEKDGGNVQFEFSQWSGGGTSGTDSTWDVVAGEEYVVEYVARAQSGVTEGTYSTNVDVYYQDGTYETEEWLDLDADVLEPAFGTIDSPTGTVVFEGDQTAETTVTTSVPNVGDGVMVVEGVSFSGVPSGITPEANSVPDRIDAGSSEPLEIDVTVDDSVAAGTHYFDATVTDSLGNTRTVTVAVEVSKPPVASVDEPVDLGDVLVGERVSTSFIVDEIGGYQGLDGLDTTVESGDTDGQISFDVPYGFSTEPGGSGEVGVTVTASENAGQHSELTFDVLISGDHQDSPTQRVEFVARVIYPADLGRLSSSPKDFVFDEPRDQVSEHTMQTTVSIPNEGDLEMNVVSVDATANNPSLSASVVDAPATVAGTDSEDATIEIAADSNLPEGTYDLMITVETEDAGTETITREVTVVHDTEMTVSETEAQFGEVTITDRLTRSIDVGERLGYNDLRNLEVSIVEGPDRWLSVTSTPSSTIPAGESDSLVFDLQFGTDAEAYQTYEWKIRVDADGVEPVTITVSATARLLSVEDITQDLDSQSDGSGWQGEAESSATSGLRSLEERLREGDDVSGADLRRSLTIAQSTVILLESVDTVEQQQANGSYEAAQPRVVSALVARNLIVEYVDEIEDDQLSSDFERILEVTADPVNTIVTEQEQHYESVLADEDATALDRYRASSGLATLSAHRGKDEQAAAHEESAEKHFAEYQRLVDEGIERRQQARNARSELRANATLTFLGQPIVANPTRIDEMQRLRASIESDYATAEERFREAGATSEADATENEAAAASRELLITMVTLYGISAILAVGFALLVTREVLNARTYVLEVREASTGDFLR